MAYLLGGLERDRDSGRIGIQAALFRLWRGAGERRRHVLPAVELPEHDLPRGHKPEEEGQDRILTRQAASGVPVNLEVRVGNSWRGVGRTVTDTDGRAQQILRDSSLTAGIYRLTFGVETYFQREGIETFYPEASIVFHVRDASQHYHVPLLLSPYGYSTYRGS
jgi:5-hydroxyisourate hydrolase